MEPFIGEIRQFGGTFAPVGWALCDGQLLSIQENEPLFALIGTTYGGDGVSTFGVPDLRGRVPVHTSSNFPMGQQAGVENVTLVGTQLPSHSHAVNAGDIGGLGSPAGNFWSTSKATAVYSSTAAALSMNPGSVVPAGGSQAHDNMHPFLAVTFFIATEGVWPPQN